MGLFNKLKESLFGISSEEKLTTNNTDQGDQEFKKEDNGASLEINSKNDSNEEPIVKEENRNSDESNNPNQLSESKRDDHQFDSAITESGEEKPNHKITSDSNLKSSDNSNLEVEKNFKFDFENNDFKGTNVNSKQDLNSDDVEKHKKIESSNTAYENKYQTGLKKSRNSFASGFNRFLAKFRKIDNQFFEDLEDFLIESDVGYELTMDLSNRLKEMVKEENLKSKEQISQAIISYLVDSYNASESDSVLKSNSGLNIYLFVGVNGAGKTTTIGKLSNRFIKEGKKVILVAGDTFRAGATEQLNRWAEKTGAEIVKGKNEQDPASLVFEGIHRAQDERADYLLIDTAGRLQNKVNLMNELDKIKRTIKKEAGSNPTETLLVIDATTGQNGLNQAREFNQVTKLSGLVLSKLDGTAKGGIVLQIKKSLDIPVKLVGLGEQVDDLVDFDPLEYMKGFFSGILQVQ